MRMIASGAVHMRLLLLLSSVGRGVHASPSPRRARADCSRRRRGDSPPSDDIGECAPHCVIGCCCCEECDRSILQPLNHRATGVSTLFSARSLSCVVRPLPRSPSAGRHHKGEADSPRPPWHCGRDACTVHSRSRNAESRRAQIAHESCEGVLEWVVDAAVHSTAL